MTNRSATALLSPVELTALCRIADGWTTDLKPDHLQLPQSEATLPAPPVPQAGRRFRCLSESAEADAELPARLAPPACPRAVLGRRPAAVNCPRSK